ncbi:phosphoribosylformylglycinamidine synthase subunit PurS [bacterium]|nr:phosphoribosylformylglycinamidine synthase subunit PurS [bacterium]
MVVIVEVMPKEGILDPQGVAVRNALHQLQYAEVQQVKVGKRIILELDTNDPVAAKSRAEEMAETLLANENVETFRVILPEEVSA